ncbi:hypothetical protein DV515_00008448 [Chloebia gouldiae]|uniref:Uncharacterized protein n=1 Tax=Chloebia gouldiae TaxID=44316 RepID=A0A3L8SEK5_CHLGU|nr:hypothetical protein DV515_00008448 [Chloebia gouldiae]
MCNINSMLVAGADEELASCISMSHRAGRVGQQAAVPHLRSGRALLKLLVTLPCNSTPAGTNNSGSGL